MIKFLSILSRYEAAEFSQVEAAELLGAGVRTFRCWRQRYEEEGKPGLVDRRLGKASGKRVPLDREHGNRISKKRQEFDEILAVPSGFFEF